MNVHVKYIGYQTGETSAGCLSDCLLEILLSSGVKITGKPHFQTVCLNGSPGLCIPLSDKKSTKELCMLPELVCTRVHQIHSLSRMICHELDFLERNRFHIRSVTCLQILRSERTHGGPKRSSEQSFLRQSIPISMQL